MCPSPPSGREAVEPRNERADPRRKVPEKFDPIHVTVDATQTIDNQRVAADLLELETRG